MSAKFNFSISDLGRCSIQSPISLSRLSGDSVANYVRDTDFVRYDVNAVPGKSEGILEASELLEKAGPREKIFFNPSHVHAGIVTCGGLCPGINDVIRAIVRCLWFRYGVARITGVRYGFKGLLPEFDFPVRPLTPDVVDDIHKIGGSMLGTSRGGGERTVDIVDAIERLNLNMLFAIGGDGTQKGALSLAEEIEKRGLKIPVVGIPKTIDNDLSFMDRSFGFETAVVKASEAVFAAHTEAHSSINGIGLVKLMGRESGFIAAHTALAVHEVNFLLIPEVPFELDGPNGLLKYLEDRIAKHNHAVIVVAEGAGQELLQAAKEEFDASGNKRLLDIGPFLRDKIIAHFESRKMEINLKYIDPSYMIRSAPAVANDSVYCERLGNNAVHAAMAGKTKVIIGLVNNEYVHLPMKVSTSHRNYVEPESALWRDAVEATQQPVLMVSDERRATITSSKRGKTPQD
jgi:6-phosphofructokinase 1